MAIVSRETSAVTPQEEGKRSFVGNAPPALLGWGRSGLVCAVLLAAGLTTRAQAQAPGVLWVTNIGAQVFAVDAQTNVYANAGATIIALDGAGRRLWSNTFCPLPGLAQRDEQGNFYFAGSFPWQSGPVDFGGITLSGPCFIAKFTALGAVVWAKEYSPRPAEVTDFQLLANGTLLIGYSYSVSTSDHVSKLAQYDTNGVAGPTMGLPGTFFSCSSGRIRLWGTASGVGYTLEFEDCVGGYVGLSHFDSAGNIKGLTSLRSGGFYGSRYARPICDSLGRTWNVEGSTVERSRLVKRGPDGEVVLSQFISPETGAWPVEQFVVGPDLYDGVHVADANGGLMRYDADGNPVWTNTLPALCTSMVMDGSGNRFLTLSTSRWPTGAVARLDAEPLPPVVITNPPQPQTVMVGGNAALSVGATGFTPFRYFWRLDGIPLGGGTNQTLNLTNIAPGQGGLYTVVVSNFVNSVTSSPALVRVKQVQLYLGDQMLTNGTYTFLSPPTLSIRSTFASGSSFYTLDGSVPSFASTPYASPFQVKSSASVRAIGYSADFSQSEEADPVTVIVNDHHTLTVTSASGGSVTLNPPGGTYASTDIVTATAVPSGGYSFLYWLGDASGANPVANISMERDKTLCPVFGTALSTTVAGSGHIELDPPGGVYPLGTIVRLTAIPEAGNYFGFWGNAATGNTNPLSFLVSAPAQTVSCIFGPTPSGQAALTVLVNGHGQVSVAPRANAYALNQAVTLTAAADRDESFLNWSGDASGTQNPLVVTMTAAKVITANFTARPKLRVDRKGLEGLLPTGFRLTLQSDPGSVYQIAGSTNLAAWAPLGNVTNATGETQFLDTNAPILPQRFYKATP